MEEERASWLEPLSLEVEDVGMTPHMASAEFMKRYQAREPANMTKVGLGVPSAPPGAVDLLLGDIKPLGLGWGD